MNVRNVHAGVVTCETTDLDVLADDEHHFLLLLFHSQVGSVVFACQKSFQISGILFGYGCGNAFCKLDELLVLCNEVRLGVYFHCDADAVKIAGTGNAFSSDSASLLLGSGKTFFSQILDSLVHIAVGFNQSLFAVHHADSGHFTQFFNICCGKSHIYFLL